MNELSDLLLGFVATLLLHASVWLAAAWMLQFAGLLRRPGWAETAWRGALFGGLLSALIVSLAPRVIAPLAEANSSETIPGALERPATSPLPSPPRPSTADAEAALPTARAAEPPASGEGVTDRAAPTAIRLPATLSRLLVVLWLAGAVGMLLLSLRRLAAVARLRRDADTLPRADRRLQLIAARLAARLQLPVPALHRDQRIDTPIALQGHAILLPAWVDTLDDAAAEALLAHELAHLARQDPLWRVLQQLAMVLLFAHPLAWLARRRLEHYAELQADTAAARLQGDGRPLAECLAHCLIQLQAPPAGPRRQPQPRLVLAMADQPGAVVHRVQRLLDEETMNERAPTRLQTRTALALALGAALLLPALAINSASAGWFQGNSVNHHVDDDGRESVQVRTRRPGHALDLKMSGQIEFADDESDIVAMANDARFALEETRDGVERSIAVQSTDGRLQHDYRVDGDPQPLDAAGKAWLAQALPDVFRSSGYAAEARVKRIHARGGADAVLTEIGLIDADHGRSRYLALLFAQGQLSEPQLDRAMALTAELGSDYEKRQALSAALRSQTLGDGQQHRLLEASTRIGSDYERAELLIEALGSFRFDERALAPWLAAVKGIGSDYEQRRVLETMLVKHGSNPAAVRIALDSARGIGSDYEMRQVLQATLKPALADPALRALYLSAVDDIGSDYERREALVSLLRQGAVDAELAIGVLGAIDGIGSDYESKEALLALAAVMPNEPGLIERYRQSARRLSDHERGEAERALDRIVAVY